MAGRSFTFAHLLHQWKDRKSHCQASLILTLNYFLCKKCACTSMEKTGDHCLREGHLFPIIISFEVAAWLMNLYTSNLPHPTFRISLHYWGVIVWKIQISGEKEMRHDSWKKADTPDSSSSSHLIWPFSSHQTKWAAE